MSPGEYFILIVVGGVFIFLGVVAIIWGKREEKSYVDSLAARTTDLREFMDHWPPRPQPGSLKLGGWLAIIIGLLVLIAGIVLWLLAKSYA